MTWTLTYALQLARAGILQGCQLRHLSLSSESKHTCRSAPQGDFPFWRPEDMSAASPVAKIQAQFGRIVRGEYSIDDRFVSFCRLTNLTPIECLADYVSRGAPVCQFRKEVQA